MESTKEIKISYVKAAINASMLGNNEKLATQF